MLESMLLAQNMNKNVIYCVTCYLALYCFCFCLHAPWPDGFIAKYRYVRLIRADAYVMHKLFCDESVDLYFLNSYHTVMTDISRTFILYPICTNPLGNFD